MEATTLSTGIGIGAIVTWDLHDTAITPDALRALLLAEGLQDDAARVPNIEPKRAVKRAAQEWTKGRGNAARYRAEVVREAGDLVEVGILQHQRVSADEVRWVQVETVTYNVATSGWASANGTVEAAEFEAQAQARITHLDHDYLRPELLQRKMAAWHAFGLRRQGGTYFVGGTFDAELGALQRVVAKLGDSSVKVYHVQGSAQTTQALAQDARVQTQGQIGTLREKLAQWQGRATAVRSDAVDGMLDELKGLRSDVNFYAATLQVAMDDLLLELDAAVEDARALNAASINPDADAAGAVRAARAARKTTAKNAPSVADAATKWKAAVDAWKLTPADADAPAHVDAEAPAAAEPVQAQPEAAPVEPVAAQAEPEPVAAMPAPEPVQAAAQPEPEPEPELVAYTQEALDDMPMWKAVGVAKKLGVKGIAKMSKVQLMRAVLAVQDGAPQPRA